MDKTTIKVEVYLTYADGEGVSITDIQTNLELERDIRRLLDPDKLEYKPDTVTVVNAEVV